MKRFSVVITFALGLCLVLAPVYLPSAFSQLGVATAHVHSDQTESLPPKPSLALAAATSKDESDTEADDVEHAHLKPFDQVIKGSERLNGLFTLYRNQAGGQLYAEIKPEQLNINYLCSITMESGIGESGVYSGLPLADFLFNFQRVNSKLQFVVPNVYFRTRPGDPLQRSIRRSFSDSVLQALPIKSIHPQRKSFLVDLSPMLLSDFPGLSPILSTILGSSYVLDSNKSYLGPVQAFPLNVELESIYGFSGGNPDSPPAYLSVLPDSRTFNLRVRYSLSQLPANNSYRPRLADDRVGYFITAYQDFSDDSPKEPFVRYVNRWHLEKQNPDAPLSPPKKPIVFWIENTVPMDYRDTVRDGVLMWNKAFEQAGFKDAIQVKQMPNNAKWDPADVRYNTIRWLSSFDAGFLGIGPSRVNPLTGEILDADILIDASFARYMKQQYQTLAQQNRMRAMPSMAKLLGNPNLCSYGLASRYLKREVAKQEAPSQPAIDPRLSFQLTGNYDLCYGMEATRQLAVGAMTMTTLHNVLPNSNEMKQYVQEFLRGLIAHEVGHTLGLRHNFRGSAMLSPSQLNNPEITHTKGLVASVMDYSAVNLAPHNVRQGDYFTHTIGPYDEWAIAYGYTPSNALVPQAETRFLDKIARRAPEPDLAYATDEDIFAGIDPQANPFDLSSDSLTYAPWQLDNAQEMWKRLDKRSPITGESFSEIRAMFEEVFDYYFQYSSLLTTYVGGQSFNRYRGGDAAGRLPFEPVPAEKQRQALALLQKYVFDSKVFRFSPEFLNKLAPSRWSHWGETPPVFSLDYPIHDRILLLQSVILNDLLSYPRLARLRDAELKAEGQVLTMPELFDTLQTAVWQEVLQPEGKLQLSSLRRGLQREHMNTLTRLVLRTSAAPEDARTLAWYKLKQLRSALDNAIKGRGKEMDDYTRAHLEETRDRVAKALDAQLQAQ